MGQHLFCADQRKEDEGWDVDVYGPHLGCCQQQKIGVPDDAESPHQGILSIKFNNHTDEPIYPEARPALYLNVFISLGVMGLIKKAKAIVYGDNLSAVASLVYSSCNVDAVISNTEMITSNKLRYKNLFKKEVTFPRFVEAGAHTKRLLGLKTNKKKKAEVDAGGESSDFVKAPDKVTRKTIDTEQGDAAKKKKSKGKGRSDAEGRDDEEYEEEESKDEDAVEQLDLDD
ncbi:hypothetical protein HK104_006671, partial [Borealophlyctis nickersoniae]